MQADRFQRSLLACQKRKPFRTFTISLVNGDRIQVDHPEALVLRDGVAVYIAVGGVPTLFDYEGVSEIAGEPIPTAAMS